MFEEFAPSLFVADGPTVSFFGFPYPTRMAVARLADGSAWVWSPIALTPELERAVESIGPVRHIVSPNKIHHLFLSEWARAWPEAALYAPPGLARRRQDLAFRAELGDVPEPAWADDIDQVVVRGSFALQEVLFFHRRSRTALIGDLVQRHDVSHFSRLRAAMMRLDGLVGDQGSTPREWRASFLRRNVARRSVRKALAWKPERLIIAHGRCARENGGEVLRTSLAWLRP